MQPGVDEPASAQEMHAWLSAQLLEVGKNSAAVTHLLTHTEVPRPTPGHVSGGVVEPGKYSSGTHTYEAATDGFPFIVGQPVLFNWLACADGTADFGMHVPASAGLCGRTGAASLIRVRRDGRIARRQAASASRLTGLRVVAGNAELIRRADVLLELGSGEETEPRQVDRQRPSHSTPVNALQVVGLKSPPVVMNSSGRQKPAVSPVPQAVSIACSAAGTANAGMQWAPPHAGRTREGPCSSGQRWSGRRHPGQSTGR